jgi:hypothetical protein
MAQPLTKSTGREEYGRSVERSPWKAIKLALKNKVHPSADLQNALAVDEILAVDNQDHTDDYTDESDWLQEAVQEKVTAGQAKYISAEVIDSR